MTTFDEWDDDEDLNYNVNGKMECPICFGEGKAETDDTADMTVTCPRCMGTGEVDA